MYEEMKLGVYWLSAPELSVGANDYGAFFGVSGTLVAYSLGGNETEAVNDVPLTFRLNAKSDAAAKFHIDTLDRVGWNGDVTAPKFTGEASSGLWVELRERTWQGKTSRRWDIYSPRNANDGAASDQDLNRLRSLVQNKARKTAIKAPSPKPVEPPAGRPATGDVPF